jgi:HEAT repeat protein
MGIRTLLPSNRGGLAISSTRLKSRNNVGITLVVVLASIFVVIPPIDAQASDFPPNFHQNRQYIAQNSFDAANILITEKSPTETLIRALQSAQYPYQRRNAAIWLGERDAREAVPHLLKALKDPEEVVQSGAAKALSIIGDATVSQAIAEELIANTQSENPLVRQYSAYVLGQRAAKGMKKIPGVVEALEAIAQDQDELVRVEAVYALYELGAPSSMPIFIEGLQDEDNRVRMHSATALGNIKTNEAAQALVAALEKETDGDVRGMIALGLGKHGSDYAVAALLATLPREREPVRANIAIKLGDVKIPTVTKALADLMLSDPSPRVRSNAAKSLLKIKDPTTVPALADALKDRVTIVRIPASTALAELADASVMDRLIDALGDMDRRVASNAADALIRINDLDAVPKLMMLIDSPNQNQADLAIDVLEALTYKDFGTDVGKWKEWYEKSFRTSDQPLTTANSG